MDRDAIDYLKSLGISKFALVEMVGACPSINNLDYIGVKNTVSILMDFGFLAEDLVKLFVENPKILCMDAKSLQSALVTLGENVVAKLNNNPFLI